MLARSSDFCRQMNSTPSTKNAMPAASSGQRARSSC
jgi:hypothetical protein